MNRKPLVSIIISFLNAEKFLKEAVESIISQSYRQWELLLVDDGSTDKSTWFARDYAKQHPDKIVYLEHEGHQNHGVCVSRNFGIKQAQGQYIAFLDADDVWLPHKLAQQVEILNAQPKADMVYGLSEYWRSWTGQPADAWRDHIPKLGVPANRLFGPSELVTLCYPLGKGAAPCPSNIMVRREILDKVGGFEEEFRGAYQLYEDQAFLIKIYLNGNVYASNECWDRYREHPDSCMAQVANQSYEVRLFFLKWLKNYLTKQQVKEAQIWQALDKAFWPYRHPTLYHYTNSVQGFIDTLKWSVVLLKKRMLTSFQ